MTWDQFGAVVLGILATVLVRLVDRWVPPSVVSDSPTLVPAEAPTAPHSSRLDIREAEPPPDVDYRPYPPWEAPDAQRYSRGDFESRPYPPWEAPGRD